MTPPKPLSDYARETLEEKLSRVNHKDKNSKREFVVYYGKLIAEGYDVHKYWMEFTFRAGISPYGRNDHIN